MRIGIDFDNTIVCYDRIFLMAAIERGLLDETFIGGKKAIRDAIRRLPDGNWEWTKLQAHVYGPGIMGATVFEGFERFVDSARAAGAGLAIVSHKSRFAAAAPDGPDLRDCAKNWLRENGLIGDEKIKQDAVFFEATVEEKLARLSLLHCTHFVDDLEEVLDHPAFPPHCERMLFAPDTRPWHEITGELFGAAV